MEHLLGSYFNLPDGGSFKTRNGEVEIHHYESYEYVPGRVIKHIWETATYTDPVGDSHNTLPQDVRKNPVKGCPFSPEMLAFILVEKYACHTPKNRIKRKLREMGAHFSKINIAGYLKKDLWAFHNKAAGLVWYLYEHGSRAREVVGKVLDSFCGSFSSDGYAAYTAFGNREEHPGMLHCGCWAHVRRYFIEALGVASDVCYRFID